MVFTVKALYKETGTCSSRLKLAILEPAVFTLEIQKSQAQNTLLQYRDLELSWSTTASFTLLPELNRTSLSQVEHIEDIEHIEHIENMLQ